MAGEEALELGPNTCAPIPPKRHSLHATGDTVVLLSVARTVRPQWSRSQPHATSWYE